MRNKVTREGQREAFLVWVGELVLLRNLGAEDGGGEGYADAAA